VARPGGGPSSCNCIKLECGTGNLGPAWGGLSLKRFKQELGTGQTSHEVTRLEEASPLVIACSKAPSLCLTTAKAFSFEANPNIRVAQKASKLVSSKMQHNTKRHGFEKHPASRPNLCSHRSAPPRSKTPKANIKFEFRYLISHIKIRLVRCTRNKYQISELIFNIRIRHPISG